VSVKFSPVTLLNSASSATPSLLKVSVLNVSKKGLVGTVGVAVDLGALLIGCHWVTFILDPSQFDGLGILAAFWVAV